MASQSLASLHFCFRLDFNNWRLGFCNLWHLRFYEKESLLLWLLSSQNFFERIFIRESESSRISRAFWNVNNCKNLNDLTYFRGILSTIAWRFLKFCNNFDKYHKFCILFKEYSKILIYSILLNLAIWTNYINPNLLCKKHLKNTISLDSWQVFA